MTLVEFLLQNASAIIVVLGFAASAVGGAYVLKHDVQSTKKEISGLKEELKDLKKEVSGLSTILVTLARYDERMNATDKRTDERFQNLRREIDLLRKGEGFVLPLYRGAAEHGGDDH